MAHVVSSYLCIVVLEVNMTGQGHRDKEKVSASIPASSIAGV